MKVLQRICTLICILTVLSVGILSVGCSNPKDKAYKVTFISDDNVTVYIYETQNYTNNPTMSDTAYSRDGDTGELLKNGKGQVNFKLVFKQGYYLDEISVSNG